MNKQFLTLNPASATPKQIYEIMSGTVVPRPIAFVSTLSSEGVANLAPFSYFMIGGSNPPSLIFSVSGLPEGFKKDTLTNIEANGEFVVNLVTREVAEAMNQTSGGYPSSVSEFHISGLTGIPSTRVAPARVLESHVQFECRLHQVVTHGEGSGSANYVIGEIVLFHVNEDLCENGQFVIGKFLPISRMGGTSYLDSSEAEIFDLERPMLSQPQ